MDNSVLNSASFQSALRDALTRYPDTVPSNLRILDSSRYIAIPDAIHDSSRGQSGHITSEELVQLVDWKLKHGKFRPSLLKLAKENSEESVRSTTTAAFAHLANANAGKPGAAVPPQAIDMAISDIIELRGIGPATASLVMSCYNPNNVPFFSDELYRVFHWLDPSVKGTEKGWGRKIGYTLKEYRSLVERINAFREECKDSAKIWSCSELEKAAWVLGKEGVDIGPLLAERDSAVAQANEKNEVDKEQQAREPVDSSTPRHGKRKRLKAHTCELQPARKSLRSGRAKQHSDLARTT